MHETVKRPASSAVPSGVLGLDPRLQLPEPHFGTCKRGVGVIFVVVRLNKCAVAERMCSRTLFPDVGRAAEEPIGLNVNDCLSDPVLNSGIVLQVEMRLCFSLYGHGVLQ